MKDPPFVFVKLSDWQRLCKMADKDCPAAAKIVHAVQHSTVQRLRKLTESQEESKECLT